MGGAPNPTKTLQDSQTNLTNPDLPPSSSDLHDADRELARRGLFPTSGELPPEATARLAAGPSPGPERVEGVLLGAALGSALGRQVKGMRPEGIQRRFGWLAELEVPRRRRGGQQACPQTDDSQTLRLTLKACMQKEAPAAEAFATELVQHRDALAHLGRASSEAMRRLAEGRRWWRAGTPSAGNGAALRAAAIGLAFGDDLKALRREAARNAVVTHADRLAVAASAVVAHAVALLVRTPDGCLVPEAFLEHLIAGLGDLGDAYGKDRRPEAQGSRILLAERLRTVGTLLGQSPKEAFGITQNGAYVLETLPAALWCFLEHPEDPEQAILTAVNGGFDADSVASLTGAFAGAYRGAPCLPSRWAERLAGAREFKRIARRLATGTHDTSQGAGAADRVHVSVLLDRSGSMGSIQEDTIGGFNAFVAKQRTLPGDCRLTLVQFDTADPQEVTIDAAPIGSVPDLDEATYEPRGGTPLLDALGMLLERLDLREEADPDEQQLVVVITDGHENASCSYFRAQVLEMVEERKASGWAFVFLGANIDAFGEGRSLGLGRGQVGEWRHTRRGVRDSFEQIEEATALYRTTGRAERGEMACMLMEEVRTRRSTRRPRAGGSSQEA